MRYMCAICMWYMLKWHIMADLINNACWLIVFVCRAVTLFPLISSPLLFTLFSFTSPPPAVFLCATFQLYSVHESRSDSPHPMRLSASWPFGFTAQGSLTLSEASSYPCWFAVTELLLALFLFQTYNCFFVFFQHFSLYLIFQTHAVWFKPKMEWIVCHFLNQLSCQDAFCVSYLGSMQICIPWL